MTDLLTSNQQSWKKSPKLFKNVKLNGISLSFTCTVQYRKILECFPAWASNNDNSDRTRNIKKYLIYFHYLLFASGLVFIALDGILPTEFLICLSVGDQLNQSKVTMTCVDWQIE